ncbi:ROK family protein [Paenibacillus antri]|uniref:ROK family protein n=1 Tax=Paenibacillus antri TaxID=2582848 RepID=A0A5R9FYX7_9BACL|nr:ROK family protein [Paenibacillus antri]TLS48711.1 ROK family protein [Paenibacillus antri]
MTHNVYSIALDIGGVFIKAAVLNASGDVRMDTIMIYPSRSKEDKETLLRHLTSVIEQQAAKIIDKHYLLSGIGFAFPGPFDYENGVCYIRGLGKFDHIYGVNLREELTNRLLQNAGLRRRMAAPFSIVFENDANLFALGELLSGAARAYERTICLTLGSGAGSAFIDGGVLVKERPDVPSNGWLYKEPFRESIVDDYISKRGILRIAAELGADPGLDVKELAELARGGDAAAAETFRRFGVLAGEMLRPFVARFRPDAIVVGGQIAKSADLFQDEVRAALGFPDVAVRYSDRANLSAFVGVAKLLTDVQAGNAQSG